MPIVNGENLFMIQLYVLVLVVKKNITY